MRRLAVRPTTALLLGVVPVLLLGGGTVAATARPLTGAGVAVEPLVGSVSWVEVLGTAERAASTTAYQATMQVVQIDIDGPYVTEIPVAQDDGLLRIGEAERWLVGRDRDAGFFVDAAEGTARRTVSPGLSLMDHDLLGAHYLVEVVGRAELRSGPALVVSFTRRAGMAPSERLFVDDDTSLVVRRETYDEAGEPVRVVALRDVVITSSAVDVPTLAHADGPSPQLPLSDDAIQLLDDAGWHVPSTLADGSVLLSATALDEESGAVQLVYSDGLYRVSIYQQTGALDADQLVGAMAVTHDDREFHRWPGSEPERVVWSGGDRTFTAISDAPADRLIAALAPLPCDAPVGLGQRLGRGLGRVGTWLWPFS